MSCNDNNNLSTTSCNGNNNRIPYSDVQGESPNPPTPFTNTTTGSLNSFLLRGQVCTTASNGGGQNIRSAALSPRQQAKTKLVLMAAIGEALKISDEDSFFFSDDDDDENAPHGPRQAAFEPKQ